MKTLQKLTLGIMLFAAFQISAQETENTEAIEKNAEIENFQLPSFSELSNDIASEYSSVRERLPNLSNIGEHVQKGLRRGMLNEHSTSSTIRNLTTEHSILPNISTKRFQLRNNLNNIMFNGFDLNQLHLNQAYRNAF